MNPIEPGDQFHFQWYSEKTDSIVSRTEEVQKVGKWTLTFRENSGHQGKFREVRFDMGTGEIHSRIQDGNWNRIGFLEDFHPSPA